MAEQEKRVRKRRAPGPVKRPQKRQRREPKWKATVREIEEVCARYETLDTDRGLAKFNDFPLSSATSEGLKGCGFTLPTDIQRTAIPLALRGRDVLGAAKTGSGKTLAFLVPLLELLWRERWSSEDGMGALVLSPTRELAYQTFEVLRKVGCRHDFSAGLVTGGKDITTEQQCIQHTNIVISTPGRLLQHMDETVNFDCSSLKMLVLDEADRILDLGFQHTVNAIIQNLPSRRQTLLFSATQTKSIRDLARLSLVDPEYVAVHENSKHSTPQQLVQSYITCKLPDKLSVLFSFIRSHLTCKIIVFMSSCKQVKFVYEVFRRMRPGVPLLALYGRQKHLKRMAIYNDFCRKKASVLVCTDVAARGLDIPAVDWVVQLDCPEDASTYIHRVGRTARYEKDGKALLFLLPSEESGMLEELRNRKIPIEQIRINPKKISSIQKKLQGFCAQDLEVKQWAQRSFICYVRSVHLQSNKSIFDVHQLPLEEYSTSLGLPRAPRVRFLQSVVRKGSRGKGEEIGPEGGGSGQDREEEDDVSESESEDDQLLFVKRVIPVSSDVVTTEAPPTSPPAIPTKPTSKVSTIKRSLNQKLKLNSHIKFDDKGDELPSDPVTKHHKRYRNVELTSEESDQSDPDDSITPVPITQYEALRRRGESVTVGGIEITEAQRTIHTRDKIDRRFERERVRQLHRKRRRKARRRDGEAGGDRGVVLAPADSGEEREGVESGRSVEEDTLTSNTGEGSSHTVGPTRKKGGAKREKKKLQNDEELAKYLLGI